MILHHDKQEILMPVPVYLNVLSVLSHMTGFMEAMKHVDKAEMGQSAIKQMIAVLKDKDGPEPDDQLHGGL